MYRKRGFTLLELIIVIIVIGILASLALPRYAKVTERARATEGKQLAGLIRNTQMQYYAQYSTYAPDLDTLDLNTTTRFFTVTIPATPNEENLGTVARNTVDAGAYASVYSIIAKTKGLNCTETKLGACADIGM